MSVPQSMYIFKQAKIGSAVTPHQDSTFLHTSPKDSYCIFLSFTWFILIFLSNLLIEFFLSWLQQTVIGKSKIFTVIIDYRFLGGFGKCNWRKVCFSLYMRSDRAWLKPSKDNGCLWSVPGSHIPYKNEPKVDKPGQLIAVTAFLSSTVLALFGGFQIKLR